MTHSHGRQFGAGYWQEASVCSHGALTKGCLRVLCSLLPERVIEERNVETILFYDLGLEVTQDYFYMFYWLQRLVLMQHTCIHACMHTYIHARIHKG